MKAKTPEINADLKKLIVKAADFHGHLGPFLVIGIRIGNAAKNTLPRIRQKEKLQITAKTPLSTPFSCVIDGIQVTTKCTVGNQKLKIENSRKQIAAIFKLQNSDNSLEVSVNPKVTEMLMEKLSSETSNEELAWEIAAMPESQLLNIK